MEKVEDETCIEQNTDQDGAKSENQLSKNQLKKQKKREKWLAIKQDKRRNAKLKRKQRLAELRESGEDTGPTRKSLKLKTMKNSSCKIRVVIDLSLDEYMNEKDVNSLTCQLQHSYAANRRAANPMQLYLCGIAGKTKERLDRIGDYKGWDIYPEERTYDQAFSKESLVYLSSESDNVLSTLSEDKVYVIGGLVDHNRHKGLCHQLAEEKGITHAQLPIGEYLDMKTRKVLTVNQVFAILLRYTEMQDWQKAFLAEMPQRKQAAVKDEKHHTEQAEVQNNSSTADSPSSQTQNDSSAVDLQETDSLSMIDLPGSSDIKDNFGSRSELCSSAEDKPSVMINSKALVQGSEDQSSAASEEKSSREIHEQSNENS